MKTDTYTKIILTVIAFCLVVIVVRQVNIVPEAQANQPAYTNYGLVPLNEDGSITVKLSPADVMDVNIKGISTRDELDINIDEVGGSSLYSSPIPVKIKE